MSVEVTTAWVLAWMVRLLPPALAHGECVADKTVHHWEARYEETADAIVSASLAEPLFAGPDGFRRTAAVLVALAHAESRFDPRAVGDNSHSWGTWQIQVPTAELVTGKGNITRESLMNPHESASVALKLIRMSMRVCSKVPLVERLGWFAQGHDGCGEAGRKKSLSRMTLAFQIAKEETP